MGVNDGRLHTGWYSFYAYIEQGFTDAKAWNMLIGWMTGESGRPNPISHATPRAASALT